MSKELEYDGALVEARGEIDCYLLNWFDFFVVSQACESDCDGVRGWEGGREERGAMLPCVCVLYGVVKISFLNVHNLSLSIPSILLSRPHPLATPCSLLRRYYTFWFISNDPCGLFCMLFTYFVVLFTNYVTVKHLVVPWIFYDLGYIRLGMVMLALYQSVIFLILGSHFRCMIADPGVVKKTDEPEGWREWLDEAKEEHSEEFQEYCEFRTHSRRFETYCRK